MRWYKILLTFLLFVLFSMIAFTPASESSTEAISQRAQQASESSTEAISQRAQQASESSREPSSEPFWEIHKELRRIGLYEIKKIGTVGFETGNFRLDHDFRLGYGDTVTVNFWGKIESSHKLTIDREGNIVIPYLGKISVIGKTMEEARESINKELNKQYSNVEFNINLTDVQDIRIMVLGNLETPGYYAVSPFCRLVEAVAKAGGPNSNGSLSDIELFRDGKQIISFNIYDFLSKKDETKNVRLKHGDTIFIPQVQNLIALKGDIKTPGIYEAKKGSKLSKIIETAGGMLPTRFKRKIAILKINTENKTAEIFKEIVFEPSEGIKNEDDVLLEHRDTIIITTESDIKLIKDGKPVIDFAKYDNILKQNSTGELMLKYSNSVYIPKKLNSITVKGEVKNPSIYETKPDSKLSKIIEISGGMLSTELKKKIYILRINQENNIVEIFKEIIFDQSEGIKEEDDVLLEQQDTIIVTTVLDYTPHAKDIFKVVKVSGEVNIPGNYLVKESETLRSLIERAGGLKETAFAEGSVFTRTTVKQKQKFILDELVRAQEIDILKEESRLAEIILRQEEKEMHQRSLEYRRKILNLMASRIPEGRIIIDLGKIINGNDDTTLEEGDHLYVPPMCDWVLVYGAVYNPEAIAFSEGKSLDYYINAVGGPNKFADKKDIYVIKANGRVQSQSTGYGLINRGDIIVIPEKM